MSLATMTPELAESLVVLVGDDHRLDQVGCLLRVIWLKCLVRHKCCCSAH